MLGGPLSYSEIQGIAAIADSPDEVRLRLTDDRANPGLLSYDARHLPGTSSITPEILKARRRHLTRPQFSKPDAPWLMSQ